MCKMAGDFSQKINGNPMVRGKLHGFRDESLISFLEYAVFLEPLNLFFYSWRFFATLENEEQKQNWKSLYRWFARLTICLIPISFYGVFAALVVEEGRT